MKQIPTIQYLRAVAALAIALLHSLADLQAIATAKGVPVGFPTRSPVPLEAGVDLFFVISGFVMVYASQPLFAQPGATRIFMARRLARIVPLYWATTTVFLVIAFTFPQLLNSGAPGLPEIVAAYLFFPVSANGTTQPVYSLGWSLNYEMYFYALFGLAMLYPRVKAVALVAAYLVVSAMIGWAVNVRPVAIAFWTDPIVLEFAMGALLANLYLAGFRLALPVRLALGLGALALLGADLYQAPAHLPRGIAWGVPAAMLFMAVVFNREVAGVAGVLRYGLGRLGDASYALYLTHPFAMRALKHIWLKLELAAIVSPWVYLVASLAAAAALALLVYEWFERPAERWLRAAFLVPSKARANSTT